MINWYQQSTLDLKIKTYNSGKTNSHSNQGYLFTDCFWRSVVIAMGLAKVLQGSFLSVLAISCCCRGPGPVTAVLVKWLEVNMVKINPIKMEMMLVGKAEILDRAVLITFYGVMVNELP